MKLTMKKRLLHTALAATLPLLLHACAKTEGDPVTAYVSKGPVTGAQCTLYQAGKDKEPLAGPVTSRSGHVDFGVVVFNGLAYVSCQGGTYLDEINGLNLSLGQGVLRAAKNIESGSTHFSVTPVTEIAVKRALAKSENGILESPYVTQANQEIADYFGLSHIDIVTQNPTDIARHTAGNTAAGWYGAVLTSLSGLLSTEVDLANLYTDGLGIIDIAQPLNTITDDLSDSEKREASLTSLQAEIYKLRKTRSATLPNSDPISDEILVDIIDGLGNENADSSPNNSNDDLSISLVTPNTVLAKGGQSIEVMGHGFQEAEAIKITFGDQEVTNFTIESKNFLTLITKPFIAEVGSQLHLTVEQGDEKYVLRNAFTVAEPVVSCDSCDETSMSDMGCTL